VVSIRHIQHLGASTLGNRPLVDWFQLGLQTAFLCLYKITNLDTSWNIFTFHVN
jgi:hypothetical protein